MSSYISTIVSASVTNTKIAYPESGPQLQVFMKDGNAVFLDYADAVIIGEAIEEMRHEVTRQRHAAIRWGGPA